MEPIIHHPLEYQLGPIPLTGFGLAVLLSFVVAQYIAEHELERRGRDNKAIGDLIIAAVVGGLLGAKIYYVILFGGGISEIFQRAGFVFWGGLIGGTVAVLSLAYIKKLDLYRILDVGGISVAAAYAVGRTGCWAVGDDYGRPWNSPFAVQFPEGAPPSTWESMSRNFGIDIPAGVNPFEVAAVHPTQIYEVTLAVGMFFILWRLRNHLHAEGWLFGVYCVMAGVERFIIEFFRAKDDADRILGTFSVAQGIAFAFAIVGIVFLVLRANTGPGKQGVLAPGASGVK